MSGGNVFLFTAPPAKLYLAGGFRTVSFFHGFGHGDFRFLKNWMDFFRSLLWDVGYLVFRIFF
ncbi:hypothetical protein CAP36_01320 [Chitinophagaceae bacterium IBVUCB2]|nr:hypothetical protein CAP36_01320 [Chitinophagaceae bacterium IBVUCB2]